jgi:glycosyltransferase involved in cell wall biosynthesis
MIIAFDGGAFQQSIPGGIFNVAKGFLNASAKLDPSLEFILLGDPRLGPMRSELVDELSPKPEVLFGKIGPAYEHPCDGLITREPALRFDVDGITVLPIRLGQWLWYSGPAPVTSFVVRSRSARPSDVGINEDSRKLGVCFDQIVIEAEGAEPHYIGYDDIQLSRGYHPSEAGYRWTTGEAVIPKTLFPRRGTVRLGIHLIDTLMYRLGEGRFDSAFNYSCRELGACRQRLAVCEIGQTLARRGATIYFANHFLPVSLPGLKLVAWAHDIIPMLFPGFFMPDALVNFRHVANTLQKAHHIFSNSEKTREDLIAHLGIARDRVTVVGIDISQELHPLPDDVVTGILKRFRLAREKFILYVATIEPRKNHARLVQAYQRVLEGSDDIPPLVLVGKKGWGYRNIVDEIRRLKLDDTIVLLEDVDSKELAALYWNALFVVYPSVYEGFGLPVLEAMACEKPVLTSRGTSMSEVAAGAAFLVDPYSVSSIADGLVRLIHDQYLRAELSHQGTLRRAAYSWEKTATQVLEVLRQL